ncbi:MAG: helix-turn-helix domain-containing protein [Methanomassiliicoccaceae archaeon]|nr:helix-turn-helix domain-containing protein [Methanomassiliicoccaceae archaeon]
MTVDDLIAGMLREEGEFQKALRSVLEDELDMTLSEFCAASGLSPSTMYKILEEKREPNIRTVREIVKAVRTLADPAAEHFIAIIASNVSMDLIPGTVDLNGRVIPLREYPVNTVEDAIIAAVRAERDGALAVVCAPIVAPTVEKILTIPVSRVIPTGSILRAIDRLQSIL